MCRAKKAKKKSRQTTSESDTDEESADRRKRQKTISLPKMPPPPQMTLSSHGEATSAMPLASAIDEQAALSSSHNDSNYASAQFLIPDTSGTDSSFASSSTSAFTTVSCTIVSDTAAESIVHPVQSVLHAPVSSSVGGLLQHCSPPQDLPLQTRHVWFQLFAALHHVRSVLVYG